MAKRDSKVVTLDGESLTIDVLARVAHDPRVKVRISDAARRRVRRSHAVIERVVQQYEADWKESLRRGGEGPSFRVYGVTTGFGEFKTKNLAPEELVAAQRNLLLSHSVGVGDNNDVDDPRNYFPAEVVRAALVIRLNAFLKGHSGVREALVDCLIEMINRGVVPLVPTRGSLGASGDLCPLSHTFVTLLGHGRFYLQGKTTRYQNASVLRRALGRRHVEPSYKEGLALSNGATYSAAMLAMGVRQARRMVDWADRAAALSVEAAQGCTRAFDSRVHAARNMKGQIESAAAIREALRGSKLVDGPHGEVQDVYSLRCAPQVHGASRDAIEYAERVATAELNAATDNPLFFETHSDESDRKSSPGGAVNSPAWSAGNFHGQPLALAADFLAIAVAELASISERRCQMLLDGHHNRGLPNNLAIRPGVNSGWMIAQYTAASLVSENKVLSHPASVDSIPSSANHEDHVSMSATACRKLQSVIGNAAGVLAIELLIASQAVEWRVIGGRRAGCKLTADEAALAERRFAAMAESSGQAGGPRRVFDGGMRSQLGRGTGEVYRAVRAVAQPVARDRPLSEDILNVRRMVMGTPVIGSDG